MLCVPHLGASIKLMSHLPCTRTTTACASGEGPGLMCSAGSGSGSQPAPKPKPNRRKPHRLVVYVDEPLFQRIQSAAAQQGYVTMQGFLESLLYKIEEENNA